MRTLAIASVLAAALAATQRTQPHRPDEGIQKGKKAVAFKLDLLGDPANENRAEKPKTFDLSDNLGTKPVVLVFGSYT